jgi:hypothetical protein
MVPVIVALFACGSPPPPRSVPIAPTTTFEAPAMADTTGLLRPGAVSLPVPFASLRAGTPEAEVRAVAAAAADPRLPPRDHRLLGVTAVDLVLGHWPDVGASLLLAADGSLREVHLSLPEGTAMTVLVGAWGPPPSVDTWIGPEWEATVHTAPDRSDLVRLAPR